MSMYAEHLLHLNDMHEGMCEFEITCEHLDTCEHNSGQGTHPDGPQEATCDFVTWFHEVGNEMICDRGDPRVFPIDPTFPIPVMPYAWDDDGPLVIFDGRPREPF